MILSIEHDYAWISLTSFIYLGNLFVNMSSKEEIKINDKNTTKFNKDNNNFNERTNNTLNQHQDAINKTLDNTLNNIKRTTDEATHEIPRYTPVSYTHLTLPTTPYV